MPLIPITPSEELQTSSWEEDSKPAVVVDAPTLLLQLQDDLARSRRREAFWISVIAHIIGVLLIVFAPKYLPTSRTTRLQAEQDLLKQKNFTFLELPPDVQKVTRPPRTNILSDKDRLVTRKPNIDRKTFEDLQAHRGHIPTPPGPPAPKPSEQPSPPAMAESRPPAQPAQSAQTAPAPLQNTNSSAPVFQSLRDAAKQVMGGALSPGSAIQQAARASAENRAAGEGGDYGLGSGNQQGGVQSGLDILSDTMGVDFGPYLARVLHDVRINWWNLIPEVARAPLRKKGKVSIEFAITKNGQVAGMRLVSPSGDVSLDRAAWGGITASNPFPPLPAEFGGSYLALRFHFLYNPDQNDMR